MFKGVKENSNIGKNNRFIHRINTEKETHLYQLRIPNIYDKYEIDINAILFLND